MLQDIQSVSDDFGTYALEYQNKAFLTQAKNKLVNDWIEYPITNNLPTV